MGGHHGKVKRNGHMNEPGQVPTFNGQPSEVVYSKSMETCSLKLYRVESMNGGREELVVLLDCGGRVYANGRRVYPFDGTAPSVGGAGDAAGYPGTYRMAGELDKCLNPESHGACTLDGVLSLISQTFEQLLKDGIRLQDSLRCLEEENTALSLKVLELKREQLQMQKLEVEKQKLELRIEELESQMGCLHQAPPLQQKRLASLVRTNSMGLADASAGGFHGRQPGSLARRAESLSRVNGCPDNDQQNNNHANNGRSSRAPLGRKLSADGGGGGGGGGCRDLENRRTELSQERAVINFQMESLSREHETATAGMARASNLTRNRRISGGPAPSDGTVIGAGKAKAISPSLYQSMERLNMDIEPRTKQGSNGQWDRYDTIRKRYDVLRQRRMDRMRMYSSQENVTRAPSRARRSHDRQSITSDDDSSNNSRDSPPPNQLIFE